MKSNESLVRAFCIQIQISKIMHESWGSIPFYLEHYPIYQYLILSIGIWFFILCFGTINWYHMEFDISSIDICFNWYLLWEFWYLIFFILLYLISVKYYPLLGIFSPSWYLFFNWCLIDHVLFDLTPFDISLHVLIWILT